MSSYTHSCKPVIFRFVAVTLCAATLGAILTGCGGGGDSGTFVPIVAAPATTTPLPTTAPAAVPASIAPAPASTPERSVQSVRLIGQQVIAGDLKVDGVLVGGLSAVDYDPVAELWYFLSDDRTFSHLHTAELDYDAQRFSSVRFRSTIALKDSNAKVYSNAVGSPSIAADPESFRIDPQGGGLWWGSEGDRVRGLDPFVARMATDGVADLILPTPAMFQMSPTQEKGSRNNATYEGLSFSADGKTLWVGMEAPIYEDGALPTPTTGAVSRFTQTDRVGTVLRQVVYPIDPIPKAPGAGMSADNGVSEILAINDHQFLILERSGVQGSDGVYTMYIRLYEIDIDGATDVQGLGSLVNADYKPVQKRLVLDLNTLGLSKVDNIEGMTWGPKLVNGNNTLVLVSDNNFDTTSQITQMLAFEVLPKNK